MEERGAGLETVSGRSARVSAAAMGKDGDVEVRGGWIVGSCEVCLYYAACII